MPAFAEVLSVGTQDGQTVVTWALVNPDTPSLLKTFRIAGTGHPVQNDDRWKFIGTVHLLGGRMVVHVFELNSRYELPN